MNETKFDKIDYIVILLYVLFGGTIWVTYKFSLLNQNVINSMLLGLTFTGPILLFIAYYRRFRILYVAFAWLIVGVIQYFFVNQYRNNPDFNSAIGTYAKHDTNLIILVIMIFIFNIVSILLVKQNFMVAAWFAPHDNRELNYLDYVLTFIGFIILAIYLPI